MKPVNEWLPQILQDLRKHKVQANAMDMVVHQGDQTSPAVLPEGTPIFSDEQMAKLQGYKLAAEQVKDYEGFIKLIEKVCGEMALNLVKDSSKIAAVMNKFRIENGLQGM